MYLKRKKKILKAFLHAETTHRMRRYLWKWKLRSWLVTSAAVLVTIASKIMFLQSSHRNLDIRIWNRVLGGLPWYKHQMLWRGYQFQSPHDWGPAWLFSDPTTAEDKAYGNSALLSFPIHGEVPCLTNSCLCRSTPPLVSPATSSPRHALTREL